MSFDGKSEIPQTGESSMSALSAHTFMSVNDFVNSLGPLDLDDDLGFDYISQIRAIRALLSRQNHADSRLEAEIERADELARNSTGESNYHAVDQYGDLVHDSIYQLAAHSMAAVGMLAPLMESMFKATLRAIGKTPPRSNLAARVMDAIEDEGTGLGQYMPDDLRPTLEALFRYRNKMLHHGFEWPHSQRLAFDGSLSDWPPGWFGNSTSDDEPWMFYMTPEFISHCLDTAEQVLIGIVRFQTEGLVQEACGSRESSQT